ncbi:MAG: ABC transporter ATP-binding protein [Alphaproteobacteria bacterium]|nr:ABC transporter ATP-binding protein [Alphaproteobacteria bacterium]
MTDATPVLAIDDLAIRLPEGGDRGRAVDGVTLSVNAGEIVCLVGESGSGKSVIAHTTMGLLPRALRIERGGVRLEGEDVVAATPDRLRDLRCTRMSMIFQEPMTALNPVMTCGRQIDEVLQEHTALDEAQRRAKILEIMTQVRLPEPERLIDAYPHQLSGGQRQRIMIAMALILEPVLLIADEPTTALDVTTQAQILSLIRDLQRQKGTGVLFITHDFGVVAEIADRVAVLQRGKLVEFGPTADVLRRPQHEYTRMLIASVPSMTPRHREVKAGGKPVLRTEKLSKTYVASGFFQKARTVHAADDVTLEIRRGETLGIVGESGSGKSTVARCIARLIDPTGGSIFLDDDEIGGMSRGRLRQHRKRVQIVFQDPYRSLNPRRTVGASIIEGPMNYGLSREAALARARGLMETVKLDPAALERFPHEFSGGQRQRICIARALAMEPELLIADEAVSALDVSVQAQVLELLDQIRATLDLAMLFITHDLRVAAQVCDRVAVMHRGKVVEHGPAGEIFSNPRHAYTRELFAAAPGRHFQFGAGPSA